MQQHGKSAFIIVDVQNDFCPGGSHEVKEGDKIIPIVNHLRKSIPFNYVYLTADWHQTDHISFASNHPGKKPFESVTLANGKTQDLWPDHCIQNQAGSYFHKNLITKSNDIIIRKGKIPGVDSYSGFGTPPEDSVLETDLKNRGVNKIFISGLAFDFCVKATALDGVAKGYLIYLIYLHFGFFASIQIFFLIRHKKNWSFIFLFFLIRFRTFLILDATAAIMQDKIKENIDFLTYKGVEVINSSDVQNFL